MELYRTRTQDEYDFLMQKLEEKGYEWGNKDKPSELNYWNNNKNETVIRIEPFRKTLMFGKSSTFEGREIMEVSELMEEQNETKTEIIDDPFGEQRRMDQEAKEKETDNPIRPDHYKNENGKDLIDEWYERLYHSEQTFTGREVFIIVLKSLAERYTRRYPNKDSEDLEKGIETLRRLKEYEEMEE